MEADACSCASFHFLVQNKVGLRTQRDTQPANIKISSSLSIERNMFIIFFKQTSILHNRRQIPSL